MKITILHGAFLPVPAIRGGAIGKAWGALGQAFANDGHHVTHISRRHDELEDEERIGNVHPKPYQSHLHGLPELVKRHHVK